MSFGYKHVLQRHLARKHPRAGRSNSLCRSAPFPLQQPDDDEDANAEDEEDDQEEIEPVAEDEEDVDLLSQLTGKHYHTTVPSSRSNRAISCPWPHILDAHHPTSPASPHQSHLSSATSFASHPPLKSCSFRFSRVYDVQRHLKAEHGFDVSRSDLDDALRL